MTAAFRSDARIRACWRLTRVVLQYIMESLVVHQCTPFTSEDHVRKFVRLSRIGNGMSFYNWKTNTHELDAARAHAYAHGDN